MAGGNQPKGTSNKPSSSSSSHWETNWESDPQKPSPAADSKHQSKDGLILPPPNPFPNPSPKLPPNSNPDPRSSPGPSPSEPSFPGDLGPPPPPPAYGFRMLDRRTIVLADGSVRCYVALPPDYQVSPPQRRFLPPQEMPGQGFEMQFPLEKKIGDERERDEFARQRQQLQYGNAGSGSSPYMNKYLMDVHGRCFDGGGNVGVKHSEVDQVALKKPFLHFAKVVNEDTNQKQKYLADGRRGPVQSVACRSRLLMEAPANENSEASTFAPDVTDHNHDNLDSAISNHEVMEFKDDIAGEEVRSILEVIAATGKFWHEWDKLKSMLSFHLKQILSEYPEAKMTSDQQNSLLGETYEELVKRLDDALHTFIEGPPFTLQRLCEILLEARTIYPKLSKLALALEKNLSVTSTLTICTDPYPTPNGPPAQTPIAPPVQVPVQTPNEPDQVANEPQLQPGPVENGELEPTVGDRDEIMAEVETAEVDDNMTIDMETFEDIVRSAETGSMPTANSQASDDPPQI